MPRRTQQQPQEEETPEVYLPSLAPSSRALSRHASQLAVEAAVSPEGQEMIRLAARHQLAMKIHVVKTATAMRQAGELQTYAAQNFAQTCQGIDAVTSAAEGTDSKPYIDQIAHHMKDQYAAHITDMYDECISTLRAEARRTVDALPIRKQSLLQRILGDNL